MPNKPCAHIGKCIHYAQKWNLVKIKATKIHKGKYDYSLITNYTDNRQELPIICPIHGEFVQQFQMHLRGSGCQMCAKEKNSKNRPPMRTLNLADVIARSNAIHNFYYDYSRITGYVQGKVKVPIVCPIHGEFKQSFTKHLTGQGCTPCNIAKRTQQLTMSITEFIQRANIKYNNKFNYSLSVLVNAKTDMKIICPIHGEFFQTPWCHLNYETGCGKCGVELAAKNKTYTLEEFIEESNKIHNNFYDYSESQYTKGNENIFIKCPKHGGFWQIGTLHLSGSGCNYCANERVGDLNRYSLQEFIDISNEIHNDFYDYSLSIYVNANTNITIICPVHGEFTKNSISHMKGSGCNKCNATEQSSKEEREWLDLLGIPEDTDHRMVKIKFDKDYCRVDGFIPETNTVYEYNGGYYHGDSREFSHDNYNKTTHCTFGELYEKTMRREQKLREAGYNVVVMWEKDFQDAKRAFMKQTRFEEKFGRTLPKSLILEEFYPKVLEANPWG